MQTSGNIKAIKQNKYKILALQKTNHFETIFLCTNIFHCQKEKFKYFVKQMPMTASSLSQCKYLTSVE